MWPFILLETVLSGFILWQGCRQFDGAMDLVNRADHWTLAGGAMLSAAFLFGLWQLGCALRQSITRMRRNLRLERAQQITARQPISHVERLKLPRVKQAKQKVQIRRSKAADKKAPKQQAQSYNEAMQVPGCGEKSSQFT